MVGEAKPMRTALVLRGLVGLWFASRIGSAAPWGEMFDSLTAYLRLDGLVGVIVASLLFHEAIVNGARREFVLAVALAVDAAGRLGAGTAVHFWPGIPDFPVTAALAIGMMAFCTVAIGLTEALLVVREEAARHGHRGRAQLPAVPIGVAGVASTTFGLLAALAVGDPDRLRPLLVMHVIAMSGVMLALAWSLGRRIRWST